MLHDLRYAIRTLRRSPRFAVSAILALALGVGANTAVFSVVYAVLLAPLPYEEPERLVRLSEIDPTGTDRHTVSIGTFVDWRARTRTLEAIAVYTIPGGGQTLWSLDGRFQVVKISAVSPALFPLLHARPILGQTFSPDDPQGGGPSADRAKYVVSYGFWQRALGGAADIIGRSVSVEGRFSGEIIGVMPRGFGFPQDVDAWANLPFGSGVPPARRRAQSFNTIARLRPGVTVDAARTELDGISAQLAAEQPASNGGWSAQIVPQAGSDTASVKSALLTLLGAVAGVLLIGCASVANLLLARASGRRRELAIRLALGAGTARLVRQCLTEALVLSVAGTIAGLVTGHWLARLLVRLAPPDIPRLDAVGMNMPLLLFAVMVATISAAFIGLAPAVQAARRDRYAGLRLESRTVISRGGWVRRLLIAGEVAVVVLLLTGASLLVRTFVKLRHVDLGFQPQHVLNVSTRWPIGKLFPSTPGVRPWPRVQRAVEGLLDAVAGVPGVDAVGLIADVPLTGDPYGATVWRADAVGASGLTPPVDTRLRWRADHNVVTAGYFPAMGIPILRGRNFGDIDRFSDAQLTDSSAPRSAVVIVNSAFASRYFGADDPIGRTLIVPDDQEFGWSRTIVGVVGDVRGRAVAEAAAPAIYIPHSQHADVFVPSLIVRSALPPEAVAGALPARGAAPPPPPRGARGPPTGGVDPAADRRLRPDAAGAADPPDGRRGLGGAGASALQSRAARLVCDRRPRAVGGRHLWRSGVSRQPAHARDRDPDGARRACR